MIVALPSVDAGADALPHIIFDVFFFCLAVVIWSFHSFGETPLKI